MKTNEVRPIDANALLDAMPKSDVLLRHQVVDVICNSPSIDVAPVITGETSDGYHTFNELYHHRAVLFSVIVKAFPDRAWKSRKHHDGSMYDGMFIVGIETPDGQASYHYDIEPYWDMFDCIELEYAPEWDGHTPDESIRRISKLNPITIVRARWIEDDLGNHLCSNCGDRIPFYHCYSEESDDEWDEEIDLTKFCPNCGAEMNGEPDELEPLPEPPEEDDNENA